MPGAGACSDKGNPMGASARVDLRIAHARAARSDRPRRRGRSGEDGRAGEAVYAPRAATSEIAVKIANAIDSCADVLWKCDVYRDSRHAESQPRGRKPRSS